VAASADDASGLQVTPEPIKQQQQQEEQQPKQVEKQQQQGRECEELQQEQLFAGAASNISSLFDMLAEDLDSEEELQQQQQAAQQQQQQARPQRSLLGTAPQAAVQLPPLAAPSPAPARPVHSSSQAPPAGTQAAVAPSFSSVFEAGVLQKHKACLSLVLQPSSSTSSGTVAQQGTAVAAPSSVLRSQPLGLRSRPVGLSLGSASAKAGGAIHAELFSKQRGGIQNSVSQQQLWQQQAHQLPAGVADDEYGGGDELVTPPRQVLRVPAEGAVEAAGSSMRHGSVSSSTAHWSSAQRQRLGDLGAWCNGNSASLAAGLVHAAECEEAEMQQEAPVVPNLQQFAFQAGG
jgi:hypothetical protein